MKRWKTVFKSVYRFFLSAVLLSGMVAVYTPAKAEYGHSLINDTYVSLYSNKSTVNDRNPEYYWLRVNVIVDGEYKDGEMFYYNEPNNYNPIQVSIQISPKTGYVLDSATFDDSTGSGAVPISSNQDLFLNFYGVNVLTIQLHTETQVTVTQIHADNTTSTSSVFALRNNVQQTFTLTPQNGEEIKSINVSPSDQQSLVSRNGNILTVSGKNDVPILNVTVHYLAPLRDTLQIHKSYGGKVTDSGDTDFWLQFDVSGSTQIQTKPLDVVLVLDRSGSMGFNNNQRMKLLQTELTKTNGFIDSILSVNNENRIAIVDYASLSASSGICKTMDFSNNKNQLDWYVNQLSANGGTQTDAGLKKALGLLSGNLRDSKKIVVLFTDGLPGENGYHSIGEAFSANAQANAIKATGADFYTISYIPDNTNVTWSEKQDNYLAGYVSIDDTNYDNIVTTPSSYPYIITGSNGSYAVSPTDTTNQIHIPLMHYNNSWSYNQKAFANSFLQTLATNAAHYYDATGNIPLGSIFKVISTEINAVATNATITDVIQPDNCHLDVRLSDPSSVQWRNTGDISWQSVSTATDNDVYYTVTSEPVNGTGGSIVFHVKYIDASGIQLRFKTAPNNGVYSGNDASEAAPDLATNQSAQITYTDILNQSKTKTSEAGPNYDSGLDTPYIYIPLNVLSITKTINFPYFDDSTLMNQIQPVQSFVFKIEHSSTPDFVSIDQTFYEVIRFRPDDGLTKTQRIIGLKKGYYRISEDTAWSWKYSLNSRVDNCGANDDGIVWFGTGVKSAAITFQNNRNNLNWLSDGAAAVNQFE